MLVVSIAATRQEWAGAIRIDTLRCFHGNLSLYFNRELAEIAPHTVHTKAFGVEDTTRLQSHTHTQREIRSMAPDTSYKVNFKEQGPQTHLCHTDGLVAGSTVRAEYQRLEVRREGIPRNVRLL